MSYPFVSSAEMLTFCEHHKVIDQIFKPAFVDLNVVASTSNTKYRIQNKAGLIRCEFLEFLIRISQYKYL